MGVFEPMIDGYYNTEDQLPRYLSRRAQDQFTSEADEKEAIETIDEFEARQERIERDFLTAIGGLPDRRGDLNPVTTGVIDREGFAIETVVFESLPDFHVTSNLYLPNDADEELPAILFLCGHSSTGKAATVYQNVCSLLARNGFVVLSLDPIGQAERKQYYEYDADEPTFTRITKEHSYAGQQCMYAGANIARYFIWDAIRGIDYLESRSEVDTERIGVTGNSGGGTQTAYVMLCDDRPSVAVPNCYLTAREEYMKTGQAHDAEQNVYRGVERGINHDDFVTAFAPKPVQMGVAQSDYFCIEGAQQTYDRTKTVYELYDRPEYVNMVVADETHGYSEHLRTEAVRWFCDHLQDRSADIVTTPPDALENSALTCTETGQVLTSYDAERAVHDLNRQYIEKRFPNADEPPAVDDEAAGSRAIDETITDVLALDRPGEELFPRFLETEEKRGCHWEKVFFKSEPDVIVTGLVIRSDEQEPTDGNTPHLVLLENGTEDVPKHEERLSEMATEHGTLLVVDPRGVGAVKPRRVNIPGNANSGTYYGHYGTEFKLAYDALLLGESLFGMRVFDVLRAHEFLTEHLVEDGTDVDVGIVGVGIGTLHARYAAAVEDNIRTLRLVDPAPSFLERAMERKFDIDYRRIIHGVIGRCDLPQIQPLLSDRNVTTSSTL